MAVSQAGILDWRDLDVAPPTGDTAQIAVAACRSGMARLAVLVRTPPLLRAASVFAEQAGLQGAQVRVFIDEREARAWLQKGQPAIQR